MVRLRASFVAIGFALAGCSALPKAGPQISQAAINQPVALQYDVVNVTPDVLTILGHTATDTGLNRLAGGGGVSASLGPGDVVGLTVFEAAAGGLFIPPEPGTRAGNFVTIGDQEIDSNGNLSVPYAGLVHVTGRSIADVQHDIEKRLSERAIEPQVVLTVKQRKSSKASVIGEAGKASSFDLSPGDRVLDLVARAGGLANPGFETFVTIQRRGKKATIAFQKLISAPENNVALQSGDIIYVFTQPRSYNVVGASGKNDSFEFNAETVSLADALSRAGGLLDARANPASVFVYRTVSHDTGVALGVNPAKYPGTVPLIFKVDLRDPTGFFLTQGFAMNDHDVVYIGNAPSVEFMKAADIVRSVTASAESVGNAKVAAD